MRTAERRATTSAGTARALLAVAAAATAAALCFGVLWFQGKQPVDPDQLTSADREALVETMLARSPALFTPAWFEPRLGYVLTPDARHEAWGTTFTSSEIGFRGCRSTKTEGSFRIVFAGDSWTFGMGVMEDAAYPAQLGELANRLGASGVPVESCNLGMPGYNLLNEVAAVEFFLGRLQPDAVVIAPTLNDVDSTAGVLPNGSLNTPGAPPDAFGGPHYHHYDHPVDSFVYRTRWRTAIDEVKRLQQRLEERGVPLHVFFTGPWWQEPFVHELMFDAPETVRYVILPQALATGEWTLPQVGSHPSAAAHAVHAHVVYQLLADALDWPPWPGVANDHARVSVFPAGPRGTSNAPAVATLMEGTRALPADWQPPAPAPSCVGLVDCSSGVLQRAATVLLRRKEGGSAIEVELAPLPHADAAYPMTVTVEIPSASGGVRAQGILGAAPGEPLTLSLPLPADLAPGAAIDVVIVAERTVAAPKRLAGRSLKVTSIRQR